jgi:hypothetical protein
VISVKAPAQWESSTRRIPEPVTSFGDAKKVFGILREFARGSSDSGRTKAYRKH